MTTQNMGLFFLPIPFIIFPLFFFLPRLVEHLKVRSGITWKAFLSPPHFGSCFFFFHPEQTCAFSSLVGWRLIAPCYDPQHSSFSCFRSFFANKFKISRRWDSNSRPTSTSSIRGYVTTAVNKPPRPPTTSLATTAQTFIYVSYTVRQAYGSALFLLHLLGILGLPYETKPFRRKTNH